MKTTSMLFRWHDAITIIIITVATVPMQNLPCIARRMHPKGLAVNGSVTWVLCDMPQCQREREREREIDKNRTKQ